MIANYQKEKYCTVELYEWIYTPQTGIDDEVAAEQLCLVGDKIEITDVIQKKNYKAWFTFDLTTLQRSAINILDIVPSRHLTILKPVWKKLITPNLV